MRVLLASPTEGVDPFCGDVIYTRALLGTPPDGVEYVTYPDAVRSGELVEYGRRASPGRRGLLLREAAVNRVRRTGALYREPFRHFEIQGDFDLVHCHTYSVRWTGRPTPVLFSNALPLSEMYRHARGWSPRRVRAIDAIDRGFARMTGVSHAQRADGAARVVAFTEKLAQWYIASGVPPDRVGIVPCFPDGIAEPSVAVVPDRIGFVAKDFDAKGGADVLDAFAVVRAARSDAELLIVGSEPRLSPAECGARGITWVAQVPREQLLHELMPSLAVLAYPSRMDGLPLVVLEAMGSGVPCVVSDYFALPEVVGDTGGVAPLGDIAALATELSRLLDPDQRAAASAAAKGRFLSTYSAAAVLPQLRAEYDLAMRAA